MTSFSSLFDLTAPIFLLIAIGFSCVKLGWFDKAKTQGLSWFVVNVGLPAAIFSALSSRSLNDIMHIDYLLVYGLGSLSAYLVLFIAASVRGRGMTESAFFGLGACASNSLMIGFPIVSQLFPSGAIVPFALTLMVENLLILPLTFALADSGQRKGSTFISALLRSFPRLLKNPIILAILLGVLFAAFDFKLPVFVDNGLAVLSKAVGGVALFSIGTLLVGMKAHGMFTNISLIVLGKLLLHPALVIAISMWLIPLQAMYQSVAVVLACMPVFSIYPLLGARYGLGALCSATMVSATLLSFITIHFFLFYWA